MKFFRMKKKQVESVATSAQITPHASAADRDRPAIQNRPGQPPYQVISKKDDIPPHAAVLSINGGPISLTPELQKNYAVLLISAQTKEVEVICTLDAVKRAGVDDEYMAIVDRLKRQGYTRGRKKLIARPEILQIIYEQTEQRRSLEEQQKAATEIQKSFDELLLRAVKSGASDIHMEVRRDQAQVRMRINGDLGDQEPWAIRNANTMAQVIYMVIADEKDTAFDTARPQNAIIDRDLGDGVRIRVRLQTLPAYPAGFDMIMRLLKMGQSGENINLDKLGYNKEQLSKTRRAVAKPTGAIIMAGTTGSGKSTSLNAMLAEKIAAHGGRIKVITVEDPPEYLLNGATQVPVVRSRSAAKSGDAKENPFASAVQATMRSDPDIIMVGEVRDASSAELLIHAVQSGHQVFTTTHASSGIDIVARLRSQHVPDDVLGSQNFIAALMYQALLPVVCPGCSTGIDAFKKTVSTESEEEMVARIYRHLGNNQAEMIRFRHHPGCPKCKQGVIGRTVASEIILPDAFMLRAFRDRQDMDAIMYHAYTGGKIALHHGIEKMIKGLVDIRDVEHKLDQISFLQEIQTSVRHFVRTSGIEATASDSKQSFAGEEHSLIYVQDQEIILPDAPEPGEKAVEIILPVGYSKTESGIPLSLEKPVVSPEKAQAVDPSTNQEESVSDAQEVTNAALKAATVANEAAVGLVDQGEVAGIAEPVVGLPEQEVVKENLVAETLPSVIDTPEQNIASASDLMRSEPEDAVESPDAKTTSHLQGQDQIEQENQPTVEVLIDNESMLSMVPQPVETGSEVHHIALAQPEVFAAPAEDSPNAEHAIDNAQTMPEPALLVAQHDCEATFLDSLEAVLKVEVERNGFGLSARFFKGRLSEPAIAALLSSDLVSGDKAMDLKDALGALTDEERTRVFTMSIEQVQAFLDAKTVVAEDFSAQNPLTQVKEKKAASSTAASKTSSVTPIGGKVKPQSRSKKPLEKSSGTLSSDAQIDPDNKAENESVPEVKPTRAFKSKLLAGGADATNAKATKDNVKSLAVARAQKTQKQTPTAKAPAKAVKPAPKATPKPSTKKPVKTDRKDQTEE
jgi:type II secretory ATPase GspE/PulE/Tfp pilus assembly ATPase PilB-like protein